MNIDLNQLLSALAQSADLSHCSIACEENFTEPSSSISYTQKHRFFNHSKRTSYIAMSIAALISDDKKFRNNVYISSVLHDIGVTGSFNISHSEQKFISQHSLEGAKILKNLSFDENISDIVKFHHENYDGTGSLGLKGDEIPLISQIIRLADTFEILYDETIQNCFQRNSIIKWISDNKGTIFSPYVVEIFMDVQSKEMFWWDVENLSYTTDVVNKVIPDDFIPVSLKNLEDIAFVFAEIIDKKSPFTYKHSYNLSKMAESISDFLCFNEDKKTKYKVAALLHDIGKLAVPNSILNKNGKLDNREYTIMKSHTYYTYAILSKVKGLEDVASWGANHHEKLNGRGYPRSLSENDLGLEDRILAVCDIYEALTANRPYRKGMTKDETFKLIGDMVSKGEICKKAFEIVKEVV